MIIDSYCGNGTMSSSSGIDENVADPDHLHNLITTRQWSAAIVRAQSHPHEIIWSESLPRRRYYSRDHYTALHTLMADRSTATRGQDVAPVVRAILKAADEIDYRSNVEADPMSDEHQSLPGSWRLLLDQKNCVRWSPLHFLCSHGHDGMVYGKLVALKALLQMDGDDVGVLPINQEHQQTAITLLDRQDKNILHHLLSPMVEIPSEDTIEVIEFLVTLCPSLAYQPNHEERTPINCIIPRLEEYSYEYFDDRDLQANYKVLRCMVYSLERDARRRSRSQLLEREENAMNDKIIDYVPVNILHAACLLPLDLDAHSPSLINDILYIFQGMRISENGDDDVINMAKEEDNNGNRALHLFVSNESYRNNNEHFCFDERIGSEYNLKLKTLRSLVNADPTAVYHPNNDNILPLELAMKAGRRCSIALLLSKYPDAVHRIESFSDVKLFAHLLSCLTDKVVMTNQSKNCLSTMFHLIRARPDVVSLAVTKQVNTQGGSDDARGHLTQNKRARRW
jgi:hypothetical protein